MAPWCYSFQLSDRGTFTGRTQSRAGRTVRLARHVKFREEKFGGVLFETQSEKVYTLNPTAAAVVRELVLGFDEREIARRLRKSFDDSGGAIEREVTALIDDLRRQGLLEEAPGG